MVAIRPYGVDYAELSGGDTKGHATPPASDDGIPMEICWRARVPGTQRIHLALYTPATVAKTWRKGGTKCRRKLSLLYGMQAMDCFPVNRLRIRTAIRDRCKVKDTLHPVSHREYSEENHGATLSVDQGASCAACFLP